MEDDPRKTEKPTWLFSGDRATCRDPVKATPVAAQEGMMTLRQLDRMFLMIITFVMVSWAGWLTAMLLVFPAPKATPTTPTTASSPASPAADTASCGRSSSNSTGNIGETSPSSEE